METSVCTRTFQVSVAILAGNIGITHTRTRQDAMKFDSNELLATTNIAKFWRAVIHVANRRDSSGHQHCLTFHLSVYWTVSRLFPHSIFAH